MQLKDLDGIFSQNDADAQKRSSSMKVEGKGRIPQQQETYSSLISNVPAEEKAKSKPFRN